MKYKAVIIVALSVLLLGAVNSPPPPSNQDIGAEKITLNGGKRGKVPFPHREHQDRLKDCNFCHQNFAQVSGSIDDLKAKGSLKKKWVMKKMCIKCHKAKKKEGVKSGPTTCSKCHVR